MLKAALGRFYSLNFYLLANDFVDWTLGRIIHMNLHMFTFCHGLSDLIYMGILIKLNANIGYDMPQNIAGGSPRLGLQLLLLDKNSVLPLYLQRHIFVFIWRHNSFMQQSKGIAISSKEIPYTKVNHNRVIKPINTRGVSSIIGNI